MVKKVTKPTKPVIKKAGKETAKKKPLVAVKKEVHSKKSKIEPEKKISKPISKKTENNGLGKKHLCYNCSTKFYDLGKEEIICPRCKSDQSTRPVGKTRSTRAPKSTEYDIQEEFETAIEADMIDEELEIEVEEPEAPAAIEDETEER